MSKAFARFIKEESGATAIEYGLVAGGIAVAVITSMSMVSCSLTSLFSDVASKIKMN